MSATLSAVAEAAVEGRNIIITSAPGIGTVSKTLFTLEEAGLSIGLLDISNLDDTNFGLPGLSGLPGLEDTEVRWNVPEKFLRSDVLVLDGARNMMPSTFKIVTEMMVARTLHGNALPAVKSVVVIFTDDQFGDAPKLGALDNSVTINVR